MRHMAVGLVWVSLLTAQAADFVSPNGEVRLAVTTDGEQRLQYSVQFRKKPVIENSPINFSADGNALTRGVKLGKAETYELNEKYPWRGVHSTAVNHCR